MGVVRHLVDDLLDGLDNAYAALGPFGFVGVGVLFMMLLTVLAQAM